MVLDGDGYSRGTYQPLDQRHNGAPIEFEWEPDTRPVEGAE